MSAPMVEKVIANSKGAARIDGEHLDVVCTDFEDRLFIVMTQFQKVGTLVSVSRDKVSEDTRGEPIYSTRVLLGKDEPEYHVIARNLASRIPVQKPILFSLGLKDASPKMLHALHKVLEQYKCWS